MEITRSINIYIRYKILEYLYFRSEVTLKELSKKDYSSYLTSLKILDEFKEYGLIEKIINPDKRSSKLITLTGKGKKVFEKIIEIKNILEVN